MLFVFYKPLQPSLNFESKARSLTYSGAPGVLHSVGSGLTHKH